MKSLIDILCTSAICIDSRYIIDRLEGRDGRGARAMMDTESATELLAVD
jgi:hypothetical protein